jgi:hypothetical protein
MPDLPSWCPNYSTFEKYSGDVWYRWDFSAGTWEDLGSVRLDSPIDDGQESEEIEVRGLKIDVVSEIVRGNWKYPRFGDSTSVTDA